jgi:hypothetical protein
MYSRLNKIALKKWWGRWVLRCAVHYDERKNAAIKQLFYDGKHHEPVCGVCGVLACMDELEAQARIAGILPTEE